MKDRKRDFLRRFFWRVDLGKQRLRCVLVIDGINRANVSRVTGKVVTLLDEDKREDALNEVASMLPHSGGRFTLPGNLHILGTTKTADRSIALLDTALRRHFDFEEMQPQPEFLKDAFMNSDIDLPEVLRTINEHLEWFLDRDHLIGHAWLMGAQSKEDMHSVIQPKIIPPIAEYFYDDWRKVQGVLGGTDDFVRGTKRLVLVCPWHRALRLPEGIASVWTLPGSDGRLEVATLDISQPRGAVASLHRILEPSPKLGRACAAH